MKARVALLITLALLAGLAVWHWREMGRLHAEIAALRAQAAALGNLAEAARATVASDRDHDELQRLRTEHQELVRLRGEVGALRQHTRSTAATGQRAAGGSASAGASETTAPAVTRYTTDLKVSLAPDQVLLAGGWATSPTGHTFVLLAPKTVADGPGNTSIHLAARFISVPESALGRLGLDAYRASGTGSGQPGVLSFQAYANLLGALDHEPGAEVLAAPQLVTASGRQAQIKIGEVHALPGGEQVELGPVLDLTPTLQADGKGIDLTGSASLSQMGTKQDP